LHNQHLTWKPSDTTQNMRNRFLIVLSLFLTIGAATACSGSKTKDDLKPKPTPATALKDAPSIDCEALLPTAERERLMPGRTVTHERSCADGKCFADTCHYNGATGKGIHVLYDCREDANEKMVRSRDYFTTERVKARPLTGIGSRAAVDDEGLSFFDDEARCLVTIRAAGDEEGQIELARIIEGHLTEKSLIR
jgi:hypothetical protein